MTSQREALSRIEAFDLMSARDLNALRAAASFLAELGQALRDLDNDRVRRLPNLADIRDDLLTHADCGHATVTLDPASAARLAGESADATRHSESNAA